MTNEISLTNENKFFMVIDAAVNLPGVNIDRRSFLKKELSKYYDEETVLKAINTNPANAGIEINVIDNIAKECINYETNKVSSLSALAGIPGGIAIIGTVTADMAQYFVHIIRILQKLMYLYGWGDIFNENVELDDAIKNQLTLFIGVMFGVNRANSAVVKLAENVALNFKKSSINKALTKGAVYPVVKKISGILGVKMTKQIFTKSISKIVPIFGGVVSGGLTYFTFKPSAIKLKNHLRTLPNADVNFYKQNVINNYNRNYYSSNIIDVEFNEVY
ncbi:TPA: hypothetical protein ACGA34_001195 [Clostridium perfringens]